MGKTAAPILILILILILAITTPSSATVFQVGDEAGWTSDVASGTDYATLKWTDYWSWASTKNFQVGDTLVFNYHKQFDSVMQVNEEDFLLCVTSSPIATYNSGSDTVTLDAPGDYYFISGAPDHCWDANQKLHVFVASLPPSPAPSMPVMSVSPAPSMSVTPAPPTPAASMSVTPSPTPSPTHSALLSSASPGNNNHLSCVFLVFAAAVASFLVIV